MKYLIGISTRASVQHVPEGLYETGTSSCYPYGGALLYDVGNDASALLFAARVPGMVLALALVLLTFVFARDLFGSAPALLPTALVALYPPVLAHGHYAGDDVATAVAIVAVCWCAYRARVRSPRWLAGVAVALGVGLAFKFTLLPFVPLALALVAWSMRPRTPWTRAALAGVATLAGALAIVWIGYSLVAFPPTFDGPLPGPASDAHGLLATIARHLPVPEPFRVGVLYEIGLPDWARGAFLLGDRYNGVRPAYYPVLFAVTTPLAVLVAWGAGIVTTIRRRETVTAVVTLVPAAWILLTAVFGNANAGVRTVLAAPVLLTIPVAGVVQRLAGRRAVVVGGGLVAATALSVGLAMPWALPYANELAGGPHRLYHVVSDGDWGQDHNRLSAWLDTHSAEPVVGLDLNTTLSSAQLGLAPSRITYAELANLPDGLVVASTSLYNLHRDAYAPYPIVDQITPNLLVVRVGPGAVPAPPP
jgi:4-amino-4-deoxy-L-arabinose transferase-like glycosyltransferase